MNDDRRICVVSLCDYNNDILYGKWISITKFTDEEEVLEAIEEMLKNSPTAAETGETAEEWEIHDYDNIPKIFHDKDIGELIKALEPFHDMGREEEEAYICFLENGDTGYDHFKESYKGCYSSDEEYINEFLEEHFHEKIKNLPDIIKDNIYAGGVLKDLIQGGYVWTERGSYGTHVFSYY